MLKMELPVFIVDSFTNAPFSGNPAAVCLDISDKGLEDELMQMIGTEMNLSETAFIQKLEQSDIFDKNEVFRLRWFTPTKEVNLCGHATLATAAVLFQCIGNENNCLTFRTLSGELKARRRGSDIALDLPINAPQTVERIGFEELLQVAVGNLDVTEIHYSKETKKLLVRLSDSYNRRDLEDLSPNIGKFLTTSPPVEVTGVILTLRGSVDNGAVDDVGNSYDFMSRYFAPWNGIPEDPVTGSAHTVLAPYWAKQLGKTALYARQCSMRGGDVKLVVGDRLDISGPATIVFKGKFCL